MGMLGEGGQEKGDQSASLQNQRVRLMNLIAFKLKYEITRGA